MRNTTSSGSGLQEYRARARRFPVAVPVRYRKKGAAGWLDGITENISETGVLFRVAGLLPSRSEIEGRAVLPVVIAGEPAAELVFQGVVVRTVPGVGSPPAVAAAMRSHRLVRGHRGDAKMKRH